MMGGLLRRSVPLVGAAASAAGVLVGLGLLAAGLFGSKSPAEHRAGTATMPGVPRHGKSSIFSEADQAVAQLPLANIAFTAPQTLQLGETTQVQLVLSARESMRRLKKRLSEIGVKHGARIRASNRMEAHLVGSGFKIEALRPEVQVVTGLAPTEWKWDVEAAKAGTHHLTLTVSAFIDLKGESTPLLAKTFDKTLTVRVTLYERVSRFVSRNWQWLWLAIGVPLATWLYTVYKRKRSTRRRKHPVGFGPP
jgi:hypothetical protein